MRLNGSMRCLLVSSSLLLGACATTNTNYRPQSVDISEPPLGQTVTADVGSTMVKQGRFVETDAIYLAAPISVGFLSPYSFSGGYYVKEGEDSKNEFYKSEPGPEAGHADRAALADPYRTMLVPRAGQTLCAVSVFGAKVCKDAVDFRRLRRPTLTTDGFQQTLIYSGRIGNKVNIAYREFSNDLARPAFNNDVEYDLSESKVIGYKGAEIEILEATNRLIRYRVLRNFNAAVR